MRVILAPDKFAGTLTAAQAAEALDTGWRSVRPHDDTVLFPMADGGEGTVAVLAAAIPGSKVMTSCAHDARRRSITARWLLLPDGTAVVESAQACGLSQLALEERDPLTATSFGVGELVRAALRAGAVRIVVGIGGTATVDGGRGFVAALIGDNPTSDITAKPDGLSALLVRLRQTSRDTPVVAAVDVRNPLLGRDGAVSVFSVQKGATSRSARHELERRMRRWVQLTRTAAEDGTSDQQPGAGAGGGLAFGLAVALNATFESGAALVAELLHLREHIARSTLVITGEGSLDRQTDNGKGPCEVARIAQEHRVPVYAIAGRADRAAGAVKLFADVLELGPDGPVRAAELVAERAADIAERVDGRR